MHNFKEHTLARHIKHASAYVFLFKLVLASVGGGKRGERWTSNDLGKR